MILTDVKSYLAERGRVSVEDLRCHFRRIDAETLCSILDHWVAKGKVRRVEGSCPNGACGKCRASRAGLVYEWAG